MVGWHKGSPAIQVNPGGYPSCTERTNMIDGGNKQTLKSRHTVLHYPCVVSLLFSRFLLSFRSHFLVCMSHPTMLVSSASILKKTGWMRADYMWRFKLLQQKENKIKKKRLPEVTSENSGYGLKTRGDCMALGRKKCRFCKSRWLTWRWGDNLFVIAVILPV